MKTTFSLFSHFFPSCNYRGLSGLAAFTENRESFPQTCFRRSRSRLPREAPHNFCAKICLHRSVEKKAHEAEKRFVILGALNGCEKRWQQQIMTFRCYFWAHRDRVSPTNPSFLCLDLQLVNLLGWQARLLFT